MVVHNYLQNNCVFRLNQELTVDTYIQKNNCAGQNKTIRDTGDLSEPGLFVCKKCNNGCPLIFNKQQKTIVEVKIRIAR